jgi:uncharacterized protein YecE (DUF72 family)
MRVPDQVLVGTAGWSIPSAEAASFPGEGPHLARYAARFGAVEINSSFHRPHRIGTYVRWAQTVPDDFRFSVKLPKAISHVRRLVEVEDLLTAFAAETAGLAEKLAVVLVQLPPSLAFDAAIAETFFGALARHFDMAVACEPRHPSWFADDADALLVRHSVARVAADPVLAPGGASPGGWTGLRYHRLHGAPRIYYSAYDAARLGELAGALMADAGAAQRWCVFDNTASGAATGNAVTLQSMLADGAGTMSSRAGP